MDDETSINCGQLVVADNLIYLIDHYHTTSSFDRLAVKYYLLHGAMA
jgi:hypothetical protein